MTNKRTSAATDLNSAAMAENRVLVRLIGIVALVIVLGLIRIGPSLGANDAPYPGTVKLKSDLSFGALQAGLEKAVEANGFAVVTRASASNGAAARGLKILGNAVFGVFRNDYAVRMLDASITAGIEAPLRFYITENANGTATLTYRKPTAVFQPYDVPALESMAAELDVIWSKIAERASKK